MFLPVVSLILSSIIGCIHKNELKEQKKEEVLFLLAILVINILMEYQMGP